MLSRESGCRRYSVIPISRDFYINGWWFTIKLFNREVNLDDLVFALRETLMCPTASKFDSDPAFTVFGIV